MGKTIAILGTLDTKGKEVAYLSGLIKAQGFSVLLIDVGILGTPQITPTVTREEVAEFSGTTIEGLIQAQDKVGAIQAMALGASNYITPLVREDKISGILALGGAQGTSIGSAVMQHLPFGFPKVIISAVANGTTPFGPVTGTKDIMVINSVADLQGMNTITETVFRNAVSALAGWVSSEKAVTQERTGRIAVTSAGVTTPCTLKVQELLEAKGYEVITFHCSGSAAKSMEELAIEGWFDAVLDISPHNIIDRVAGGEMAAEEDRLIWLKDNPIPYLLVPGSADFVLGGAIESLPQRWLTREHYRHNAFHTHIRASYEEMYAVGSYVAERLVESSGPVAVVIPGKGFSQQNIKGGRLYGPQADEGFIAGCLSIPSMSERIEKAEMHINQEEFAELLVGRILNLMEKG